MKTNILKGICAAAVCIAVSTVAAPKAQAASTNPFEKATASYFQDSSSMRKSNMSGMKGNRMRSDSTGKMGNMKGKSSGGYKNKGMGKSKMDTTTTK